jgi:hypothetical protein
VAAVAAVVSACGGLPDENIPNRAHDRVVPTIVGLSADEAIERLKATELQVAVTGEGGDIVVAQAPPAGWPVWTADTVRLALGPPGLTTDVANDAVAAASAVTGGSGAIAIRRADRLDTKHDEYGADRCFLIDLYGHGGWSTVLVSLHPVSVLDVSEASSGVLPRPMSEEEIADAALATSEVAARVGGRPVTTASAGGGDGAWCAGPPGDTGNYCDTVMVFIEGEAGGPLLVSVNWMTGRAGITGQGQ